MVGYIISILSPSASGTQELITDLDISRATLVKRLSELSGYGLIEKVSEGNARYYKLNLKETDKRIDSANE